MTPEWNIAVIDGRPEVVVNLAGIAALVRYSPLGADVALEAAVGYVGEQYREELTSMVRKLAS